MTGWVRGKCGCTKLPLCKCSVWRQEKAPCRKVSTFGQGSDEGKQRYLIIRTEGDEKLESTNKEAGSTERTKDAKQQSRMVGSG